jgi:DNA-binding NtrC family response regulator
MLFKKPKILIIEDQKEALKALTRHLSQYDTLCAQDGEEGLKLFFEEKPDLVLTDVVMPKVDGMEVFKKVRTAFPETPIIIMSAFSNVKETLRALQLGAVNFIEKPIVDIRLLKKMIQQELKEPKDPSSALTPTLGFSSGEFEGLIGKSKVMIELFQLIHCLAPTDARLLILGEEGTGKELVANAIQKHSKRANAPFIDLNLSAINLGTFESELFGHKRGSYTGALSDKKGAFLQAEGGTLFLDEIGEVNLEVQIKLLRVLTKKEVKPVGSDETFPFDVRLICATNASLEKKILEGSIRRDFYDRIAGLEIQVPPLRERLEDIPLLVDHFLKKLKLRNPEHGVQKIHPEALHLLQEYSWPGNVRELENTLSFAFFTTRSPEITLESLRSFSQKKAHSLTAPRVSTPQESGKGLSEKTSDESLLIHVGMTLPEVEKLFILKTLKSVDGNKTKAAQILGIGARTIHRKLKEYEIEEV